MLSPINECVPAVPPSIIADASSTAQRNQVPIIGFSATFSRPDQLALSAVFEKIVFHREVTSMLEEGW
jgi:ATP-dependent helicase IRC3